MGGGENPAAIDPALITLANSEPGRALSITDELLAKPLSAADRSIVLRARGMALREGRDLAEAADALLEAIAHGQDCLLYTSDAADE